MQPLIAMEGDKVYIPSTNQMYTVGANFFMVVWEMPTPDSDMMLVAAIPKAFVTEDAANVAVRYIEQHVGIPEEVE